MKLALRHFLLASVVLAAVPAQAQNFGQSYGYAPAPLYPYAMPPQAYGYPAQPQYAPRAYPYVRPHGGAKIMRSEAAPQPKRSKVDPALIEELRHGRRTKTVNGKKIDRTIYVRGKPIVVESQRVVNDPPIVIKRHYVVDVPAGASDEPSKPRGLIRGRHKARAQMDDGPRVIRAEAEVHILGPDRMSIKLFRKGTSAPVDLAND